MRPLTGHYGPLKATTELIESDKLWKSLGCILEKVSLGLRPRELPRDSFSRLHPRLFHSLSQSIQLLCRPSALLSSAISLSRHPFPSKFVQGLLTLDQSWPSHLIDMKAIPGLLCLWPCPHLLQQPSLKIPTADSPMPPLFE